MIWISSSSSQAIISVSPSHVYPVLMLGDNSASENRRSWEYWWWWDSDGDNRIEQTDSIEEDLIDELQWITEVKSWWWIWSRSSRLHQHQVGHTLLYLLHYVQDLLYLPHYVKFLCLWSKLIWSVCLSCHGSQRKSQLTTSSHNQPSDPEIVQPTLLFLLW